MQDSGGAIINIASVSAVRPSPGTAAYSAAKAGLLALTRSLAQEWAPKIRVNAIVAGLIETEQADVTYGSPETQAALAASLPIKRLGRGQDIADAALFLASPLASYVNGAELAVDGGGERPPFLDIVKTYVTKS
jgi:NAD(P)-dependent dehydrogenase (short-subunit alcohol dehydrogenase family)